MASIDRPDGRRKPARVPAGEAGPWEDIDGTVPAELVQLARRCREADGGMPLAAEPWFLRRRWGADGGTRFGRPGSSGNLLAAGAVSPGADGPIVTGLVDPEARGRGLGSRLLDHALRLADSLAADAGGRVTVEAESVTTGAAALFGSRGLRPVFAEDVLSIDLTGFDDLPRWPAGSVLTAWNEVTADRFFRAYQGSFRERPGFPAPAAADWIAENESDSDFRPGWSIVAEIPGIADAGFVTAAVGWIVQVGVLPAARGRGLGRALVTEALRRMVAAGETEAWLTVNVDNPGAARLYRRLGFADRGRRARYRR